MKLKEIYIDNKYIVQDKSTSDGAQDKYYKDGIWYKIDHLGGEGMSEYLASLVLKCTNLSSKQYVAYDRCKINGLQGCLSKDFCRDIDDGEFITFYRLYTNIYGKDLASVTAKMDYDDAIEYIVDFIKTTTGLDVREYLANTFFLDRIILNTDRHFNNMGVIYDGEEYHLAPIFDNGKSLLVGCDILETATDMQIEEQVKKCFSKAFSPSYELNYRYMKNQSDVDLDITKLRGLLETVEDCIKKRVLLYQLQSL